MRAGRVILDGDNPEKSVWEWRKHRPEEMNLSVLGKGYEVVGLQSRQVPAPA